MLNGVFLCVYTDCGLVSLARLRPIRRRQTRIKYKFEMADRRDLGGGGDDPENSSQHMIETIWQSLTDIQRRMDQQAPVPPIAVPPGDGETVPIVPVPPPLGVEVPFVAPLPPPPQVLLAEEPVMQVKKFLRLQPPTYSEGPNPDIAEHWVHEIERAFATMRCPTTDKVVLTAYHMRGFTLEWWRLKMQTTFAGLRVELQDAIVPLMCKTVEEAAHRAATLDRSIRTRQEEDGDVDSNFSKVVVGQRWRSRSRVLPGSPLFHQGVDVIIAISRDI
ncbi:hypothetical protein Taro_047038 [Colocasia esculenta]|uniref:Gag protein n=1 Tax=Colocasia esculenta TaxID=4460 RepID=A0A843X690_COLES|nr:hypothetical protein [Colocasia esculenta]